MRTLALLIVAILLTACSSLPEPVAAPLGPAHAALVLAAQRAMDRGDPAAKEHVARILAAYPESVDGRRFAQNLRIAAGEGWRVYEEATAAHLAAPTDAALTYLYARSIPDRELQRDLFKQAISLDPSLYWGWFGLAVAALELGDAGTTVAAARGALQVRPDEPAAMLVLASGLERTGERVAAEELYVRLLATEGQSFGPLVAAARRTQQSGHSGAALAAVLGALDHSPGVPVLMGLAWSLLDAGRIPDGEVRRALQATKGDASGTSLLLRARCLSLLGDASGALRALNAARGTEVGGFVNHDEWFTVAIAAADYRQAARILLAARPALLLESAVNSRAPYDDRLDAALVAASRSPHEADLLAELSRALGGCGFTAAAADIAARAVSLRQTNPDLQFLLADALAWQTFQRDLRRIFERAREGGRSGDYVSSFDEVRADISQCSIRRLGRDLLEGVAVASYPFVGSVIRTDSQGSPPEWMERGTLLVVGQRTGTPVTAVFTRLVGHMGHLLEDDVEYDLAIGRGSDFSMEHGVLGAIAGFTLPGWIVIDLDVTDGSAARIRRAAARVRPADLWPALDEETRRSTWFPGGVRERLAARIRDRGNGRLESDVLSATLAHECGHAVDADQYIPFMTSLPRVFLKFARHGFSVSQVEIGLERTAEIWSLRTAPDIRVALTNTLIFLPHARSAPPHSVAYHGIVAELIERIDRHPADYPSIDRDFNILQQLDRLTDEELRRLTSR